MNLRKIAYPLALGTIAIQLSGCFLDSSSPTAATTPTDSSIALGSSSSADLSSSASVVVPVELGAAPTLAVLPWNGAKAAYSIIMDDYCSGTTESLRWADSVAFARQISVGFAIVAGSCQQTDWDIAKAMIAHGSEPVNHSLTHSDPATWAAGTEEITASTQAILVNTGVLPTFMAYPFDKATVTTQADLVAQGYLGARNYVTRTYGGKGFNSIASFNGIKAEYDARQPAAPDPNAVYQLYGMDAYADQAVTKGAWALRETHGVEDGSWGEWTKTEFIAHFDHLAMLQNQGDLWVAPPSKVIRYVNLAKQATWNLVAAPDAYEVQWGTSADTLARYGVPLRIQVSGTWKAFQGGVDLGATANAAGTVISANPALGTVRLVP